MFQGITGKFRKRVYKFYTKRKGRWINRSIGLSKGFLPDEVRQGDLGKSQEDEEAAHIRKGRDENARGNSGIGMTGFKDHWDDKANKAAIIMLATMATRMMTPK